MLLEAPQLTPSGRPVLQAGEVEKFLLDKVDLEFQGSGGLPGKAAEAYKGGYIILTSRRLVWIDAGASPAPGNSCQLPLACIHAQHKRTALGLRPKVRLELQVYIGMGMKPAAATEFHASIAILNLRCRGDSPEPLKAMLQEQVAAVADAAARTALTSSGSAAAAGGVQQSQQQQQQQQQQLLQGQGPLMANLAARAAAADQARQGGVLQPPPPPQQQQQQPPAPPPAGAGTAGPAARADPQLLRQLIDMGFPLNRSARALMAVRNEGVDQAMDYLLAFGDQPGMDDPLPPLNSSPPPPPPPPSAYGTPPGSAHASYPHSQQQQQQQQQQYGAYPSIPAADGYSASAFSAPGQQQQYGSSQASQAAQALAGMSLGPHGQPPYPQQQQQHPHQQQQHGAGPGPGGAAAGSSVGVVGIVRREVEKVEQTGRAVESAFQDLQALMSAAADMVALAQRFRGVLAAGQEAGADDSLLDPDTQAQLIALGITSPVTRETAGARYHQELCRQLADFLLAPSSSSGPAPAAGPVPSSASASGQQQQAQAQGQGQQRTSLLKRYGGMMALPDVYCLFNRARGTELVSPDDILQAAKLFAALGLPLRLRAFPSGATVIQGEELSDARVCASIAGLVEPAAAAPAPSPSAPPLGPAISSGDVARALGVSVAVAAEQLLLAEGRGVLCRDDGPEGLRFFRNFFRDAAAFPLALQAQ